VTYGGPRNPNAGSHGYYDHEGGLHKNGVDYVRVSDLSEDEREEAIKIYGYGNTYVPDSILDKANNQKITQSNAALVDNSKQGTNEASTNESSSLTSSQLAVATHHDPGSGDDSIQRRHEQPDHDRATPTTASPSVPTPSWTAEQVAMWWAGSFPEQRLGRTTDHNLFWSYGMFVSVLEGYKDNLHVDISKYGLTDLDKLYMQCYDGQMNLVLHKVDLGETIRVIQKAYALLGVKVATEPSINLAAHLGVRALKTTLPAGGPSSNINLPSLPVTEKANDAINIGNWIKALFGF